MPIYLHAVCCRRMIDIHVKGNTEAHSVELDIPDWVLEAGLPGDMRSVEVKVDHELVRAFKIVLACKPVPKIDLLPVQKLKHAEMMEALKDVDEMHHQFRLDFVRFEILMRVIADKRQTSGFTLEDLKAMVGFWDASDQWQSGVPVDS